MCGLMQMLRKYQMHFAMELKRGSKKNCTGGTGRTETKFESKRWNIDGRKCLGFSGAGNVQDF
jgi:hypothetical protein